MPTPKKSVESGPMKEDSREGGEVLFDALGFEPGVDVGLFKQDSTADLEIGEFLSFHDQIQRCPGNLDQLPKFLFGKILFLYHKSNFTGHDRQNQPSTGLDIHNKAL